MYLNPTTIQINFKHTLFQNAVTTNILSCWTVFYVELKENWMRFHDPLSAFKIQNPFIVASDNQFWATLKKDTSILKRAYLCEMIAPKNLYLSERSCSRLNMSVISLSSTCLRMWKQTFAITYLPCPLVNSLYFPTCTELFLIPNNSLIQGPKKNWDLSPYIHCE